MSFALKYFFGLILLAATSSAAQPIRVALSADVPSGWTVGLRGDTMPLSWDRSIPLADEDGDGVFSGALDFALGTGPVAYKAVMTSPDGELIWEQGGNRSLFPGRMAEDRRAFDGPQTELPAVTVSSLELDEDLAVLRSAMLALHPGLMLHNTEQDLDQINSALWRTRARLNAEYQEAIPMPAVYLAVAEAVAAIRDGHTQVSMYNQGAYLTATLYARADRAPFSFRLVGRRMIVSGDATPNHALPAGTEILAMDGRSIGEILRSIMPYASADGANDLKRLEQLEVTGTLPPAERFDVIYSLLYEPEGALELTVRRPGEPEAGVSVGRLSRDDRRDVLWSRDASLPRSMDDLLRYRLVDDSTAYVYIGSFATFNMSVDYGAWLTEAFRTINASGAKRLIVDLRDVAGGMDDAATLLLSHILQGPISDSLWQSVTAYDRVPEELRPHVRSWSDGFYDLRGQVTETSDGQFEMSAPRAVSLSPAPDAFTGKVAVLVDATASSATFYLAKAIKENGVAPLIGQTTGGSLKGLNGGQMAFLTLPNTGIVVDVPLVGVRPAEPGPDRGIDPDVPVTPDADAVIAGRDPEMEAALEVLNGDAWFDGAEAGSN